MLTNIRTNQLWRLMIGYFFDLAPYFMLPPLVALTLAARGVEPTVIGGFAAISSLGYVLALLSTAWLVRRFGARALLLGTLIVSIGAILAYTLTNHVTVWALCSAVVGLTGGVRYTIVESWVATLAPAEARGRALAALQTLLGAAFFAASGLLLVLGPAPAAFVVAAALMTGGLALMASIRPPATPQASKSALNIRSLLVQIGAFVMIGAFVSGLFESGTGAALPLYGLAMGLNTTQATWIITAIGVGSFVQYPFGYLADRFSWRRVSLGAALVTVVLTPLLPLAYHTPALIWVASVFWGCVGGGLYTLASIRIGALFRGAQLVGASSIIQMAYMGGSILGPALGGFALESSPQFGLAVLFATIGLTGLLGMLLAGRAEAETAPQPAVALQEQGVGG
jgi:MFS family permease